MIFCKIIFFTSILNKMSVTQHRSFPVMFIGAILTQIVTWKTMIAICINSEGYGAKETGIMFTAGVSEVKFTEPKKTNYCGGLMHLWGLPWGNITCHKSYCDKVRWEESNRVKTLINVNSEPA